ncbi:MAG: isoaspartyl peptidase/L-asparaginase [bacterium]|nr:isoaspartyl peptidase/L-asparaginase [bacterium]
MSAIIIHGGAGNWRESQLAAARRALPIILQSCWTILQNGASAVDVVVEAVRQLEDATCFNAGHGSVENDEQQPEMDAIVINGQDISFGAVAGLSRIGNPVLLANTVRTSSPHSFLIAAGAERFAMEQGFNLCSPEALLTPQQNALSTPASETEKPETEKPDTEKYGVSDTVGACVLDNLGNFASALSTGGTRGKKKGRVGDVPVIGSGAYASNKLGAVAATGRGEDIMRSILAYSVALTLPGTISTEQACQQGIEQLENICGKSEIGLICLNIKGNIGWHFNTKAMPGGHISSSSPAPSIFGC